MKKGISTVLLSYKEADNLRVLLPEIRAMLDSTGEEYEILVIDVMQPQDDTALVCEENDCRYIIQEEPCFGGAFRTGIRYAQMDKFLILDSDGSHKPCYIPAIYEKFMTGDYDVVVGSRYVEGGQTEDARSSVVMSHILNGVFRFCLGLKAKDISTDYRMYHTEQLKRVELTRKNYDVLQEVLVRIKQLNGGIRIGEVPISFCKRMYGESKRRLLPFIMDYGRSLFFLMALQVPASVKKWSWRIVLAILAVLYGYYILCSFAGMQITSDFSNLVLEGKDILGGNLFLRKWNLTGISFITTDLLYFIAGVFFWGVSVKSYVAAVTLMFLMLVFASFLLMGRKRPLDALIYLAIAGLPCVFLVNAVRAHTGGVIWVFLGLAALNRAGCREERNIRWYVLATVLFSLAVCGDATSLIIVILPVLLIAVLNIAREYVVSQKIRKEHTAAVLVSALSIAAGLAADKLYFAIGHANKNSFLEDRVFVPFESYYDKLCVYLNSLFGLFGADFPNAGLMSVNTLFYFLRSVVILIGFCLIIYQIRQFVKGKKYDPVSLTLGVGFLLISVIYIITDISTDVGSARYIAYVPSAFAILIIRFLHDHDYFALRENAGRLLKGFVLAAGILLCLPGLTSLPHPEIDYDPEKMELVELLRENHLSNGYAEFWNASSLTVYAQDDLSVRAVADFGSGVKKFKWFCKNSWYKQYADFIIVSKEEDLLFGITAANVRDSFGEPQRIIENEGYEIWVYDHDISEKLKKKGAVG